MGRPLKRLYLESIISIVHASNRSKHVISPETDRPGVPLTAFSSSSRLIESYRFASSVLPGTSSYWSRLTPVRRQLARYFDFDHREWKLP